MPTFSVATTTTAALPEELKKWEGTRQQGIAKFIFQNGILAWGVPMFAIMTFVVNRRAGEVRAPQMILVAAMVWALGGALFGWVTWTITERKYQKYLAGLNGGLKP